MDLRTEVKTRPPLMLFALVLAMASCVPLLRAQNLSTSVMTSSERESNPYKFTGIVTAFRTGSTSGSRGSGAVSRHPKIVVSCAHVIYDRGAWIEGDYRWFWKWPSSSQPSSSQGRLMRGAIRWASYHQEARADIARGLRPGTSSSNTFDYDITGHWSFENTAGGGYAGWVFGWAWSDEIQRLEGNFRISRQTFRDLHLFDVSHRSVH